MRAAWLFGGLVFLTTLAFAQPSDRRLSLVNSSLDEQNPLLSPDGQTLYFTISNHERNVGGKKDLGDIWFSTLTPNGWGAPVHGGSLINNTLHNTVAGFSADGTQLFLMGHYASNGNPVNTQGMAVSTRVSTGWSAPKNITIPYYKNLTPFESGTLSADGRVLVFSAESYGTLGAEDIYVSFQTTSGKWTEPMSLGRKINTPYQDVSPSLSADAKRLFFASNGRAGVGSFDLYYADRLDDTWQNWSEPVGIGPEFNTEGRELFYHAAANGAFYTSTQNSDGFGDIKYHPIAQTKPDSVVVTRYEPTTPEPAVQEKILVHEETSSAKVVRVWGKVMNAKTNDAIAATLDFHETANGATTIRADATGQFNAQLEPMKVYSVKVEAPGFIGVFEKLDLSTQVLSELEMNFRLQPVEVGTTVNLKNVLFKQSTATLLPESYNELDMVVDFMKQNPHVVIELAGHTDNRGYHHLNMKLSQERVNEVKKYLTTKGIDAKRVSGKGYGGTKPIADNDADETRALNRRVEFTIVKN